MRPTCGCCNCNSAASSMVRSRSFSEMKEESALSIVVLPEPVPPEMMSVMRARTAAASNSAICGRSAPTSTSLFRLKGFLENFRIDTSGPSIATGRTATLTREPSRSRASHIGCASSTRRPTAETILLMMRSRCELVLEAYTGRFKDEWPSVRFIEQDRFRRSAGASMKRRPMCDARLLDGSRVTWRFDPEILQEAFQSEQAGRGRRAAAAKWPNCCAAAVHAWRQHIFQQMHGFRQDDDA